MLVRTAIAVGVAHGEWWRIVTAAFLHYGPLHLAMNMYSLYFAGSILEQVIGRWRFLLLYLGSGHRRLGGRARLEPADAPTVGASGAIFGDPRRAVRPRAARHIRPAARSPA